jgi:hypothetical protein
LRPEQRPDLPHFPALLLGVSIEIALIEIAFERIRKPDFHRGRHDDVATRLSLKFFARESQKTLMQGVLRANVGVSSSACAGDPKSTNRVTPTPGRIPPIPQIFPQLYLADSVWRTDGR